MLCRREGWRERESREGERGGGGREVRDGRGKTRKRNRERVKEWGREIARKRERGRGEGGREREIKRGYCLVMLGEQFWFAGWER
jgi:hypothetical protein